MRRFLLLLLTILSSGAISNIYAQEGRLTAPKKVCLNAYASMHAFIDDLRAVDSVRWTIDPPGATPATYTHSRAMGAHPLFKYISTTGQSATFITDKVGIYNITVTIYYTSGGGQVRNRTRSQSFEVFDCSMDECEGTFTPATNFKETFGQFYAGAPRRAVDPPATVGYTYAPSADLADDFYSIHYNSRTGGRPEWDNVGDHTDNGYGGMLIANSSDNPKLFYRRTINGLCPGAKYNFSAWFINLNSLTVLSNTCQREDYRYAGVTFVVRNASNNAIIRQFNTNDVSMDLSRNLPGDQHLTGWQKFGGTLTLAPGQQNVIVEIMNNNPGGCGNDIAVDDIEFVFCAPKIYSYIDGLGVSEDMVCPGAELTLTSVIEPSNYFANPIYRWEMNKNNAGWVTVGAPYANFNTPVLNIPAGTLQELDVIEYRLMVFEAGNVNDAGCYTPSNRVLLTVPSLPTINATRPAICRGDTTILRASPLETPSVTGYQNFTFVGPRILTWPTLPAPKDSVMVDPIVTSVYDVRGGINYGRYANGTPRFCYKDASITITVDQPPVIGLGPDQILCAGTPVTLDAGAANTAFPITWTPGGQTSQTITFPAPTPGTGIATVTNQYRLLVRNGECSVRDTINITGVATAIANINMPQFYCGVTAIQLKADALTAGYTGLWTIVGATYGATITNPTLATGAQLTNVPLDQAITVRWTVSAVARPDCSSYEELTVTSETAPTATVTGPFTQCAPDFQLSGNVPGAGMQGVWVLITGTATFDDPNSPTAIATVTGGAQTVRVEWRVSRTNPSSVCTPATRQTTLTYTAPPILNVTGVDINSCANTNRFILPWAAVNSPTSYIIEAFGANPMPGFVTKTGSISGTTGSINTAIPANTPAGTYTFRLTARKTTPPNCNGYTYFTVRIETPSTVPTITVSAPVICAGTSATLTANGTLGSGAQWVWYQGGCGTGVSIGSGTTITVSPTAATTYYVRAEGAMPCGNTTCASATVNVDMMPAAANAGPDQEHCNNPTFNLAATAPSVGLGTWTVPAGVTLTGGINNRNAVAIVPAGQTATLTWTVTNGTCTSTPDNVILTNLNPIIDNVISQNQLICAASQPAQLTGTGVPTGGTGTYTYQWEFSTTSATGPFSPVPSATGSIFQPPVISQTTWYRRIVNSGACASTSNVVQIRIATNPPVVVSTPAAIGRECLIGTDYTALFGVPVFSHPDGLSITVTYNDVTTALACGFRITRTWTATDACMHTVTTSQAITITDTTVPLIAGIPNDTTVNCDAVPVQPDLTATDNCDNNVAVTKSETRTNGACANSYTLTRRWTARDACGNETIVTQIVTVRDTTAPVVTTVIPATRTVNCDAVPVQETITATDNCSTVPNITITRSEVRTNGACANSYTLTRTWLVRDECGNDTTITQVMTVQDTTAPVVTTVIPATRTVNCDAVPVQETITATDNCSTVPNITITRSEVRTNGACANSYTLTRTWLVRDECGNDTTITQVMTVQDTTAPVVTTVIPAARTVNCDAVPVQEDVTAIDNCSTVPNISITKSEVRTNGACANSYTLTRTWLVRDECGNDTTITQVINVQDTTAPVVTTIIPAARTVDCDDVPVQEDITATDNCSTVPNITVIKNETRTNGACTNSYILTRTWLVRDECGNDTTITQVINVQDTTAPVFSGLAPADTTVNCNSVPTQATITATDNCSTTPNIAVTMNEVRTNGACANTYTLTRTWTARDECGNDTTITQVIHVQDTTAPVFAAVAPADTTVNCNSVPTQATITATDNCSTTPNIAVTMNEVRTNGACANTYTLTRTWTARDECGNDTTITQVIHVQDTTAPVFAAIAPADTTVNCNSVPTQATIAATDNCSTTPNIAVTMNEVRTNGTCANTYTLTRTWTARDECGNDTTITQVIHVQDTTAPVFAAIVPADTTVNCNSVPTQVTIAATDNCSTVGNIAVTMNEVRTNGTCANTYTLTRTWRAVDECGNDTTLTQVIHVQDTTAPVVTTVIPAARTVDCDAVPVQEDVTAIDNCSTVPNISITKSEVRTNGACANTYTLTRTWLVRDECGNDTTITQVINVQDTTAPVVTTIIPAARTVDCDDVPVQEDITATDNCSTIPNITVIKTETRTNGTCTNSYTLTRTWLVRDECGNDTTITQVINVQDTTAPVFSGLAPADTTVNCNSVPTQATITATDNCSTTPNIAVTMNEVRTNGACANTYTLTRTWTARDECGNDTTITQVIHVQDTTAPVFAAIAPADTTVNCNSVPTQATITATDNCSTTPNIAVTMNEVRTNGVCANTYTLTRTWTARDECGNDTTITQVIHVQDTTAPVFAAIVPADTTVNCNSVPTQVTIAATDNCSAVGNIAVTMNEVRTNGTCANTYTLTRTWRAVDECGNDTTLTQVIHVQDTTAPVFAAIVPADTTVNCNSVPTQVTIAATDNCSAVGNIAVTMNEVRTNGTCANTYTLTRTWRAVDECGNDTTLTQVIHVQDTTAPVFSAIVPADTTVNCNSVPTQATIAATDNCSAVGNIAVTMNEVRTNGTCANTYTLTRTWRAVDECGNDTTLTQVIHVQDTTAPVVTTIIPAARTVDCDDVPVQEDITATDNCSAVPNISITKSEVRTNGACTNSYTLTRTWLVRDECGNDTTITQVIHVQDTTAPVFSGLAPADTTVNCNSVPTQATITATDNCSTTPNIAVTMNEVRTNGACANTYTLTRTWTARDECGNDTTITQVIHVQDTTAPVFAAIAPADTTVDCNSIPTQVTIAATDNCSTTPNVAVTMNEVRTNGACANTYTLTRTWTARDECGNDTTITQVINVRDTTAPIFDVVAPADTTVNCDAVPTQPTITATDNCSAVGNISVTMSETRTNGACANTYILTRTWTARDECGNDTTITQVINVRDTTAPIFDAVAPADTTVNCDAVPAQPVINATDNCSVVGNIAVTRNEVRTNGACPNTYTLTRTWTATDECGNDTTITQVITVQDTTAPVFAVIAPADTTVDCNSVPTQVTIAATDNCSTTPNVTVTMNEVRTNGACANTYTLTRTWTAVDECGNDTTITQVIHVQDTTAPVVTTIIPAARTVDCDDVPVQEDITATDNCSAIPNITVIKNETRTNGACTNSYILTRTWLVRDECGNDTTITQVINVQDTVAPRFDLVAPADTTVDCNSVPTQPTIAATDNCSATGNISVTMNEVRTNGACANTYTLTRTWTARDECGNDTTITQVINVRDTTAPIFDAVAPADTTVNCDAVPTQPTINATDNCSVVGNITVTRNEVRTNGTCPNTYILTRTWTATDECGNDTTITQVINVRDTTAPAFTTIAPADTIVNCDAVPTQPTITATDNCSATGNITVTMNEVRTNGACANTYTLTRTWTAVDECGNDTTITQVINVRDTTAPIFDAVAPADTTVNCDAVPTQPTITATDNCSTTPNIAVTMNEVRTNGACPNTYTLTRTWTARDECGNDTTLTQVITVQDTTAPVFAVIAPADTTVDCSSVPTQATIAATDNCSTTPNVTVTMNEVRTNGTCANTYTLTRTWTAVDECGNDTTITQVIHVQDTTAPVVTTIIPAARTVDCDAVPVQEDITATDNCSTVPNISITKSEVRTNGACANSYTLTRTWLVRDECGNDTTITQVINVQDTTAPVVTTIIPAAITVDCDAVPVQEDITATDNCSTVPNITVIKNETRTNGACTNSYTLTRTWLVRDECGNDTTITQVINVQDTVAPRFDLVAPADTTVDCNSVPTQPTISATDNCSATGNISVTMNEVRTNGACANTYTLTRTWTATDECGNDTTITQVINVRDTTAPIFDAVAPADTTVNCDAVPTQPTINATDNCSATGNITVTMNEVRTNGACANSYILTRTWTATDECGNDTTITQVINVRDTTAPIFAAVAPADTTVNCDAVPTQPTINATDNCSATGNITVTMNEVRTNGTCANTYILTRTWTATDECGNDTTITQVIHVQDTTAPAFTAIAPADTTVDCNSVPTQATIAATDNCSVVGNITVTMNEVRTNGTCANTYILTRTWTAVDECGNDTTITQVINVRDTTAPIFAAVVPADTTVNCDAVPTQPTIAVTDNCSATGNITVTMNEVRTNGTCANTYTLTRTWTAVDECGNDTTITQVINVRDTTAPAFTAIAPADTTVNCDAVPTQPTIAATDNCSATGNITVTMNEVRTNGACANTYTLTRTWTAVDECGNDTTITQVIHVQDTTAPAFTTIAPADTTVNCDAVPTQPTIAATDNCSATGNISVTMNEVRTNGTCPNTYILTRTWTAVDECGNDTTITQVINVRDTTAPAFTTIAPADTTVNCDAVPAQPTINVTDNCSVVGNITVTMNEVRTNGTCANTYTLTRTWTAIDECGNDTTITQVINVRDTTAPIFDAVAPADTTVNCDAVPTQPTINATDNCSATGNITVTMNEVRTNGACANTYILTRTWTAIDECGNDTTITQVINVRDTTAPIFDAVAPADTTVNCDAVPTQPVINATDNCSATGNITVTRNEVRTDGSCANSYILTRTWTAVDECGNDTTITQVIHVQDTSAPVILVVPADTTVNCDAVPAMIDLVATDNCNGPVTVTKSETRQNGTCDNSYILTRTWTATDACGNDSTYRQIVTVQDTTHPTILIIPADTTVNCDAVPAQPDLVGTDNCSATVTVTKAETRTNGTCDNNYILTRTWTATDACGNDTTYTQVVTVQDTTKPIFPTVPADTTVNCDVVPAQVTLAATDNCSGTVTVTMAETRINGSCINNYQLIRTWTATDACGNDSIYRQVVTVQDTTKPMIPNAPADTTVNCDAVPAQVALTGTDNCGGIVTITTGETRINGSCANSYQLIRTWMAVDVCGNDTTYTQVVTVRDTTNPVFDIVAPADTTVSCSEVPVFADLTATDNCAGAVTVTKAETRTNGNCANNYQLIRTWTATDACGNDTIYRQMITVVDTTKPVFTLPVPADTTVSCHAIPTQADLSVTDNCSPSANITVLKNEIRQPIPGACVNNYFLIRTWTALDECRNSVTVTQTITVVDTTRPTFTSPVPADVTVECNAIPTAPVMTATDNCSTATGVTVNYTENRVNIPGACVNNYQLVRTWTAMDECGNSSIVSQTITVQDTTAPVFTTSAPANATVECDMVPAQPALTATDNCSAAANVTVTMAETRINGSCTNNYQLIRTWTATDECGNDTTITQTLTVMDRTKPVFTSAIPADTTVNCDRIPVPPVLTANDKCSATVTITFNEQNITIPGACVNNYRLLRTWTATDECGNYTTVMQVVTVVDTTRPVFTMPVPANITVDCNVIPTQPDLTATDNCSAANNVTVTKTEQRINGNCANNYQLIRIWTATDECGNRATATQTITVQDTTKPVFNMPTPADATVECNNIPAQPVLTATDNCSTGTITVVRSERMEQIPGAMCASNYRLIRTWTATDECGNSTTVQQTLTVVDNTAPGFTIAIPADMTVDCNNIPAQPSLTATDNCTPTNRITVVRDQRREDIPGACVNNYRLIRTWTATDECGNRATATQVITVQDTTRPTFTVSIPADATVECSAIPAQPNLSVTDNCTPSNLVTVVKNERREAIPGACVNNYLLIRTWTATDECGNSRTVQQTLTVTDRTAPAFTMSTPADATVECNAIPVQPNLTAMDNCSPASAVTVTRAERRENIPGACANNYRLIRTWTAMDECGNSRTVQQVITVQDTTKPVFTTTPPADITVECNAIPAQPDLTATDNCSAMNTITIVKNEVRETIPGACANNYRLIRTWTATDECGNSRIVRQVVTVQDKTAPVFNMVPPTNMTVNCHEVPAAPVLTATDNCSMINNVTVVYSFVKTQLSSTCVYNYRLDRMWTATDECGNKAIVRQVITVIDTTRPVFNAPTPRDTTVSCESIPNPQIVTASDNCSRPGGVIITHKQTRQDIPGACKNYRLINTWTAKDECGNTSVITQVVTVVDTTSPVIAAPPADITIMCGAPVPTNMIELNATDNCDGTFPKKVKYTIDPYVKDLCNGYTIIRRWSVSDACGNAAQDVTQRIIVRPCPKPELEADVVVNCSSNPFITLRTRGNVNKPVYVLVGVTPANAVQVPLISTNNRFNLNGATTASFIVRDGVTGCASDTMTYNITYMQMPVVNLGNDTSICGSNGMVLDAGPANFGYTIKWSTGETTQRIRVVNPGTYKVTVSNGMCVTTDSIKVGVIPMPLVNLPDTTICRGQNVKLDANVTGASYLWSTGATTPAINVSTQERFWVRVMKNGCITIDTINVTVNPPPDISLSRDTTICPGQTVMLTVTTNAGRIQWGNGELGNSIMVNRAGNYSVSVYRDNCVVKEFVKVSERPDMKFDLGPDRIMCPGGSILIDARNPDAASYRWNDGDLNPVKSITQGGKYIIGVLDRHCDRYKTDSINVIIAGAPTVNLGNDTTICRGIRYQLKSNAKNATSYRWSTGATTSSIEITQPGTYSVTAYNDCGSNTDVITIDMKECDSRPDFPNVFSPNGDGNNDVFRPVIRGPMYDYELRIFNRWGEMVFISKDMHLGWDGTYKGRNVDVSTFVWWLSYKKVRNGPAFVIKGDVTVIR
ncbi:T9SS type B sorting domain-containing protein [Chitinophaga sp. SYP-B3965]|uniref:HYR-like domain-containing protein n=1 Tax=Chitinophaga sp. SYP-B3965 TaxID=2663120 RepID=UPI001299559E|nr:gliding motility-associated C-terminal domain-containing protein [Chitinophaga sp. SYP-B3965]MRG44417.1 T9SS type B sorting domain-containing protein [Chitinophaga sp. SYP-B3965]